MDQICKKYSKFTISAHKTLLSDNPYELNSKFRKPLVLFLNEWEEDKIPNKNTTMISIYIINSFIPYPRKPISKITANYSAKRSCMDIDTTEEVICPSIVTVS